MYGSENRGMSRATEIIRELLSMAFNSFIYFFRTKEIGTETI